MIKIIEFPRPSAPRHDKADGLAMALSYLITVSARDDLPEKVRAHLEAALDILLSDSEGRDGDPIAGGRGQGSTPGRSAG